MAAHAGERARQTGSYICSGCGKPIRVARRRQIPRCPACGCAEFNPQPGSAQ